MPHLVTDEESNDPTSEVYTVYHAVYSDGMGRGTGGTITTYQLRPPRDGHFYKVRSYEPLLIRALPGYKIFANSVYAPFVRPTAGGQDAMLNTAITKGWVEIVRVWNRNPLYAGSHHYEVVSNLPPVPPKDDPSAVENVEARLTA